MSSRSTHSSLAHADLNPARDVAGTGWLVADLDHLNTATAREFLGLATALKSIATRAREVASLSGEISNVAVAGRSQEAVLALEGVLEKSERIHELGDATKEILIETSAALQSSLSPLRRLLELPLMLKTAATLARIEQSRQWSGSTEVTDLASGIEELGMRVDRSLTEIDIEVQRATEAVSGGIKQLNTDNIHEREQATELFTRSRSLLQAFRRRAESSREAAHAIREQYAGIRGETDKIVMSLQAEDIARQRIEHVQEALRQAGSGSSSLGDQGRLLLLQRSQLDGARDLLERSVQTIRSSLRALRPQVDAVVKNTQLLASQTDEDGRSFATSTRERLEALSSSVVRYSSSARGVISIVQSVFSAVSAMVGGMKQIEKIQSSIHLIALNAQIKTAQLGAQGKVMAELATELRKLTRENAVHTRKLGDCLGVLTNSLRNCEEGSRFREDAVCAERWQDMGTEILRLADSVTTATQDISGKLGTLVTASADLRDELASAGALAAGVLAIRSRFDHVLKKMERDLQGTEYVAEGKPDDDKNSSVSKLATLYSMHSERVAHEQMFGSTGEEQTTAVAPGTLMSEFGDDIELF